MQNSWDKMVNYVSQYDKLFRVTEAAFYTGISRQLSSRMIRKMLDIGMLKQVKSTDRGQYYRYNKNYLKSPEYKAYKLAQRNNAILGSMEIGLLYQAREIRKRSGIKFHFNELNALAASGLIDKVSHGKSHQWIRREHAKG